MSIGIGQYLPDHVRWTLLTLLWVVFGIVLAVVTIELKPMPASSELQQVSGAIEQIDAQSRSVSRGRDPYWFYLTLQGSSQRYRFDDRYAGSFDEYIRIRNALRRGDRVTLLIQENKDELRIWQIHRGGDKLLSFLTVFDAEWEEHLLLYVAIGLYLPLSVVAWRALRRRWLQPVTN
jgi:hypothetical protein